MEGIESALPVGSVDAVGSGGVLMATRVTTKISSSSNNTLSLGIESAAEGRIAALLALVAGL
jgi:hypothetical protein